MCESAKCLEQAKSNEAIKNKQEEAKQLANRTGEWYGVYRDEYGFPQIAKACEAYPFFAFASPDVRDA